MTGRLLRRLLLLSLGCFVLGAAARPAPALASPAPVKSTPETALQRIQRTVAMIDAQAKTPEGEAQVVARLSAQLGVSVDSLQAEHDTWHLGYGEIAMAYGFARASRTGKTAEDVVGMRSAGTSWLDIAKELHVKVDTVANRMKRHLPPKRNR